MSPVACLPDAPAAPAVAFTGHVVRQDGRMDVAADDERRTNGSRGAVASRFPLQNGAAWRVATRGARHLLNPAVIQLFRRVDGVLPGGSRGMRTLTKLTD